MKNKITLLVLILLGFISKAQIAERPQPEKLYNNLSKEFPDFLNAQEAAQLEEKLEVFSNSTSNQICVVIVDDLNGYETMDYATRLGNQWGAGKKGVNNGVVVLIKPTKSDGGRDLAIAVGYGLEGAIPDLATKRVREEQMLPEMKAGNYFAALDKGTDVLMQLAKGEINVKDYTRQSNRQSVGAGKLKTIAIIVIFIIILLFRIFRGGGGRGTTFGSAGRNIYWGGGGFGGGSWGGGGSSSGGGWGGFGGGSFGGGGSSGKW